MKSILSVICLFVALQTSAGDRCESPVVKSSEVYTTDDILLSSETAYIIEFSLACSNDPKDLNLYADIEGKYIQVSKSLDNKKFQLSWTMPHKQALTGDIVLNLYDGTSYGKMKQAQHTETKVEMKPTFTIPLHHKGAWKGLWVKSESVALVVALFVWYMAYKHKSQVAV